MPKWFKLVTFLGYAAGIAACIYFIGGENLTARESGLVGIVLTILSILASWSVSHHYSESQHSKALKEVQEFHRSNLKTYARKAAEKVNNLSSELGKLSAYLEKELTRTDYENTEEELNAKEERIESAIHITNTLKSINDTALSDWEGVIGDELEERRAEQQEQEEELQDLLSRYESMVASLTSDMQNRGDNTLTIQKDIDSLRRELRFLSSRIGIMSPFLLRPPRPSKNVIETSCPVCKASLTYKQRAKEGGLKAVKCTSCDSKLVSRYTKATGFQLELRRALKEIIPCPACSSQLNVEIDQMPSTVVKIECIHCHALIRVARTSEGLRVTLLSQQPSPQTTVTRVLDEGTIERVKGELPAQPWPKGIHKEVAAKLSLTNSVTLSAINELIRRGVFNPQVDGRVYFPANPDHQEAKT